MRTSWCKRSLQAFGATVGLALSATSGSLALPLLSLGNAGCFSCTTELRGYSMTMRRDVPAAAEALRGGSVELCVPGHCARAAIDETGAVKRPEASPGGAGGTITGTDANTSRMELTFGMSEGGGVDEVRVRVFDAQERQVLETTGQVSWSSDGCHSSPDKRDL